MRSATAAVLGALAVLAAVGIGLSAGRVARPAPPTAPVVTFTPAPTPSPTPLDEAALFRQPLSGGCATTDDVWVVTNGGGLLRYDGEQWVQIDATLRSLTRATCTADALYSVGLIGTFVVADERERRITANGVTIDDLFGVSVTTDGALLVGSRGAVFALVAGTVQPFARGITEDLRGVVAFSLASAWAVGVDGVTYRLDDRGWSTTASAPRTLLAIAATTPANAVAVGEGGTIVRYEGGWKSVKSGVEATLRDVTVSPQLWIAGDAGTLLTGTLDALQRVDLHTSCDLVSVFPARTTADVWVIGRSAGGGGVWRMRGVTVAQHWGGC